MSEHIRSSKDQILHYYSKKMLEVETNKVDRFNHTLNKKFSWVVFILSSLFTASIFGILFLSRIENETQFTTILNEFTVNIGFNFLFTYGFSQALLHTLIFPQRLNLYLGNFSDDKEAISNKTFYLSALVGILISVAMSVCLYHLWIDGDAISPILDTIILIGIFIHMMRGLNCWYTGKQLFKIQRTYLNEMKAVIEEFEEKRRSFKLDTYHKLKNEETPID